VQGTSGGTGSFYGTTQLGGSTGLNDGIVFDMSPTGVFNVLYTFNGTTGQNPVAQLVQGTDGNFYGTTVTGGSNNLGTVFKITPAGGLTVIHNFAGNGDGAYPYGSMVLASDGNLYGTSSQAISKRASAAHPRPRAHSRSGHHGTPSPVRLPLERSHLCPDH
jgi:uncharacterized repeat protein (TIGR03803 family)